MVHEFLAYKGLDVRQIVIKVASYSGIGKRRRLRIRRFSNDFLRIKKKTQVLVVDDIYDSGETIKSVKARLSSETENIKVATLYLRRGRRPGPDFYVREVSKWVVFPHEILDLTKSEIRKKSRFISSLL